MVFGRPVQNHPSLGRIIADGPGLACLQESCQTASMSCELVDQPEGEPVPKALWPQIGNSSSALNSTRIERFYAEQWRVVMGAIEHHEVAKASLTNAFWQLVMFKLRPEMNDALVETLRMPLRRAGITASLTPNVEVCQEGDGHSCNRAIREWMWRFLQLWQHAVVGLSALFLIVSIAAREPRPPIDAAAEQLFAIFCCCLVGVNGIICGVLSGRIDIRHGLWLVRSRLLRGRASLGRASGSRAGARRGPAGINR